MKTKKCNTCGRELSIDMFYRASNNIDGHANICKECESKRKKEYRETHKESIKKKKKEYYIQNKEEILLKHAEYRETHKEQKAETNKKYAQKNKEKIHQYQKEYRASHKASNSEYQKQYREKNKDKLTEYKKSPHSRYMVYKRNAKNRDLDFNLSEDEFIEISGQPCIYCGEYSDTYNSIPFNGIDRINSKAGYQKDNCVPCCSMCNKMKFDYDVEEWINKMIQIINYYYKSG